MISFFRARRRLAAVVLFIIIFQPFYLQAGDKNPPRVDALPGLVDRSNWQVESAAGSMISLTQWPERLGVKLVNFEEGKSARLIWAKPVTIPEWADGFSCVVHSEGGVSLGFVSRLIIQDAKGVEFLYDLRSPVLRKPYSNYYPANHRALPIRLTVPGLKRPVVSPQAASNIWPAEEGKRAVPVAPLQIRGLQLDSVSYRRPEKGEAQPLTVYWGDFAFTRLNWRESPFYYSLADDEHFGEQEPLPGVTLGQLGLPYVGDFSVSWEVRDRFDGQPILTGGKACSFDNKDPLVPLQRVEFTIQEKGTYWIRLKRKWSARPAMIPQRIDEYEFRLDVIHGKNTVLHPSIKTDQFTPYSLIRIAPDQPEMTYKENQPFVVKTIFARPAEFGETLTYRLEVRPANGNEVKKSAQGAVSAAGGGVDLDLNELAPGAYRLRAELLSGDQVVDRSERLIGRIGREPAPVEIPPSVPSWQQQLAGPASFIRLQPHAHDNEKDRGRRWELLKQFVDQAVTVTPTIEYIIRWSEAEVMPGVYDWTQVDRLMDYAQEKKASVMLWPSIAGAEPEWLPSLFEEPRDAKGSLFNSLPYTFHGGRINHWHSDVVRAAAFRFLRAVATRYKNHPAVTGYYVLTEHPYDLPVLGWFVGGSAESQAKFRAYCQQAFSTLERLNQRWGTAYKDWSEVGVPPATASERHNLDWLAFLRDAIGRYLVDSVKEIRKVDSHRLIQVYLGGADSATLKQLPALGCMVADGGSQYPETFGGLAMGIAEHGVQRRPEEVSVGNWSAMFPTQLDATLFTMLLGGGGNANCKMFIPVGKPFADLRKPKASLDRFERFIPIWNELRQTEVFPRETFSLYDRNAQLLASGATQIHPDVWSNMLAMEGGVLSPEVPLEMAVKGKLLLLSREASFEKPIIEGLVDYVKTGGTLIMRVDTGRRSPDLPTEDWVLLQRLGFKPPADAEPNKGYVQTQPIPGEVFASEAKSFRLRDFWTAAPQNDEQVLATFQGDARRPAITWKKVGRGRVVMVWASTIVPAQGGDDYPLMRDLARWAGVTARARTDSTSLWTNLLRHKTKDCYYGLVYHSAYPPRDKPAVRGNVYWSLPKTGRYRITELITGADLGLLDAPALAKQGLPVALEPFAVAIYRLDKVGE